MGYADRLYALQLEFGRSSEARKLKTAQRFQEIRAEQTRQARERAAWQAGNAPEPGDEPPTATRKEAPPKRPATPGWDDEDSFWEFRGNRLKY
ncbi:hypothetical protein BST43_19425 [Mycobacteroides saopaulense]|uniref:Uncharacterized protein n=1 Tax=Mycobacteroides saopaulense TaxID=1578165 RepID=A0A1X0ITS0_9MYCO|nr:hypothetical protein BST43_19425 [Mycobacteroides saopaulense]